MPPPPERRWPGIVVGYAIFLGLLALATTPLYLLATGDQKPLVARLAVALVAGVVLLHLRSAVRKRLDAQPLSGFERALAPPDSDPELAAPFVTLRDEVRFGVASRSYFDHILWPRLAAIAARQVAPDPSRSPSRPRARLFRRGPSLAALSRLVIELEDRA